MAEKTYPCSRCAGVGRLDYHSGVLAGVCFKCRGTGRQASPPVARSPLWAVFGEEYATGMRVRLYNVRARSAQGAVTKARRLFETRASEEFRGQYSMAAAVARPADEVAPDGREPAPGPVDPAATCQPTPQAAA